MMSAPERASPEPWTWSYGLVPTSIRDWLRNTTEQINSLAYRTACDTIRMGRLIAEVKARLKRRTFKAWASAELPWHRSHAYRLIAVAEAFGPLVSHGETERIEPTALYLLSKPEVPPEARLSAVTMAAQHRVTTADAREILKAHRRQPELTPKEVNQYQREVASVLKMKPAEESESPFWDAVRTLFNEGATIHISAIDEDDGEFPPLASVTIYREDDRPRNFVRRHLGDAILAAAGREVEKDCPSCGQTKPVVMFGDNEKEGDGRNRYCRECERARLLKIKHEGKAKKKADEPAAPTPPPP